MHWHFDALDPRHLDRLAQYRVVVVPDAGPLDEAITAALRAYVTSGGILLATGSTSVDSGGMALADVLGVCFDGSSAYSVGYLSLAPAVADGLRTETPILLSAPFRLVTPTTAECW